MTIDQEVLSADLEVIESMAEGILDALATLRQAIADADAPAVGAGSAAAGGS